MFVVRELGGPSLWGCLGYFWSRAHSEDYEGVRSTLERGVSGVTLPLGLLDNLGEGGQRG